MMLRITQQDSFAAAKRHPFFSWDLLKGLSIATALHLALFLSIQISSPTLPENLPILLPTTVAIDLGGPRSAHPLPAAAVCSSIEKVAPPQLLHIPPPNLVAERASRASHPIHEPDFTPLEAIPYDLLPDIEEEICLK